MKFSDFHLFDQLEIPCPICIIMPKQARYLSLISLGLLRQIKVLYFETLLIYVAFKCVQYSRASGCKAYFLNLLSESDWILEP